MNDDTWQHNDSAMRAALIAQRRDDGRKSEVSRPLYEDPSALKVIEHPQSPCANSSPRLDAGPKDTLCANCDRLFQNHSYVDAYHCVDPKTGLLLKSKWLPKPDVSQLPAGPEDLPVTVTVNGRVRSYDKLIALAPGHCERLREGAVLKNLRTGEMFRVNEVGRVTIHVLRCYGATPLGRIDNDEELHIMHDGKTPLHTETEPCPDPLPDRIRNTPPEPAVDSFDALERACWNFLTAADTPELSAARKEKIRSMFDRAYHKFHRYPAEPQRLAHRTGVPPTASESCWRKTIEVGDTVRTCDAWTQGRVTKVEHSAERVFWISTSADGKQVYNMALMHKVFLVAKHDEGERFPAERKPVAVGGNDALADAAFGKVPKTNCVSTYRQPWECKIPPEAGAQSALQSPPARPLISEYKFAEMQRMCLEVAYRTFFTPSLMLIKPPPPTEKKWEYIADVGFYLP